MICIPWYRCMIPGTIRTYYSWYTSTVTSASNIPGNELRQRCMYLVQITEYLVRTFRTITIHFVLQGTASTAAQVLIKGRCRSAPCDHSRRDGHQYQSVQPPTKPYVPRGHAIKNHNSTWYHTPGYSVLYQVVRTSTCNNPGSKKRGCQTRSPERAGQNMTTHHLEDAWKQGQTYLAKVDLDASKVKRVESDIPDHASVQPLRLRHKGDCLAVRHHAHR